MEPLSIACTVGAVGKGVYQVISTLYTFFDDASQIDETTQGLTNELNGLKLSLRAIEDGLKLTARRQIEDHTDKSESSHLWGALDGNLRSCEHTIDQLNKVLENQLRGANSSLINRATRQLKLNLKKDQILSWRSQIHIHTNALNLALQMVNVYTTSMVPSAVIGDLAPRIEELKAMIEQTPSSGNTVGKIKGNPPNSKSVDNAEVNGESSDMSPGGDVPQTPDEDDAIEQLEKLKESARTIISDAATIVAQSEIGEPVMDEPILQDPNRAKTLSWLSTSDRLQTGLSSPIHRAPLTTSEGGESQQTPHTEHGLFQMDEDDINDESDEDYDFEVDEVTKYMVMGREKFTKSQYADATKFLLQGIAKADKLPPAKMDSLEILKSELTLAECYYQMNDLDTAKTHLLSIVRKVSAAKMKGFSLSQVHHLLAQVLLLQGHLEEAEQHCRLALRGRRNMRSSNQKYESEALMSAICQAKGDDIATELYREMIPEALRENVLAQIRRAPIATTDPEVQEPILPSPTNDVTAAPANLAPAAPILVPVIGEPNATPITNGTHTEAPIPPIPPVQPSPASRDLPLARLSRPTSQETGSRGLQGPSMGDIISPTGAISPASPPIYLQLDRQQSIASTFSDSSTLSALATTASKSRSSFSFLKPKSRQSSSANAVSPTSPSTNNLSTSPRGSVTRARTSSLQTGSLPFCQSAGWIRERGLKGGMASRTEPVGVTRRTRGYWKCKECTFQSLYFPTAPNQSAMEDLELTLSSPGPRSPRTSLSTSPSSTGASPLPSPTGPTFPASPSAPPLPAAVRCKWIFLAKSHLRADNNHAATTPTGPGGAAAARPEPLFGCVFCDEQGALMGSWAGPEALLSHVVANHCTGLSAALKNRFRVVIGREPVPGERWDLVLPAGAGE